VDSKTKAAIAISILSALGQTALQLSDYHNPSLALGLLVAMVAPAAYAAWHGTNVWRETHHKAALRLEPIYVVIFGLLIAAAGVGWQWYRQSLQIAHATTVSGADSSSVSATAHYGIAWNFDDPAKNVFYLGGGKGLGEEAYALAFQAQGKNVSDDFISCSSGIIRSDLTGKILNLYLAIIPLTNWRYI
jgi:hypothetical protein